MDENLKLYVIAAIVIGALIGIFSTAPAKKSKKNLDLNYTAVPLLSANEKQAFRQLLAYCKDRELLIFTKIRLIDLLQPTKGAADYTALKNKIIQKHVDFVICDNDVNVKLIIELDDSSHKQTKRRERDELVNEILNRTGYKILHTNGIQPELLDKALSE